MDRHTEFRFKNGLVAYNRIVVPPMASQTADLGGFVTEETLRHYSRLSEAKAGIIFVEYSYIDQSGRAEQNQIGVDSDEKIEGLRKIAMIIKAKKSLAGLQLVHAGGKTKTELTKSALWAPSPICTPVFGWQPEVPIEISEKQIEKMISWYLLSVRRAVLAGFDLVELHAAHGYGLNQWLSPLTNKRNDQYGSSLFNRSRLLIKLCEKIKRLYPNIILSIRLPAQDRLAGGLSPDDVFNIVEWLRDSGADVLNVSSGLGGWRRGSHFVGEGYLVGDAAAIKEKTDLPVIGVGGIESSSYIDQILKKHQVDFAAVGRAILENPVGWNKKNMI